MLIRVKDVIGEREAKRLEGLEPKDAIQEAFSLMKMREQIEASKRIVESVKRIVPESR